MESLLIDEEDEEIKQLMLRISRKEITLCETCDTFFDYIPRKRFCDECGKERERKRLRELSPEIKERKRKSDRERAKLPEEKERKRKYDQRPEVKERRRKYARERYHRLKKLRKEE